jgi:hypothetical protein
VADVVATVSVEVAVEPGVRLTLVGVIVAVMPVAVGEMVAVRASVPVNPELVIVHVEVAEPPGRKLAGLAGPQLTAKVPAATVNVTVAV